MAKLINIQKAETLLNSYQKTKLCRRHLHQSRDQDSPMHKSFFAESNSEMALGAHNTSFESSEMASATKQGQPHGLKKGHKSILTEEEKSILAQ